MSGRLRVLLVGVGGQGVLTAARVLGDAALAAGVPVVVGQVHGMAQRGGSVEGFVLFGPGSSAFIGLGEADVVVGFEPLETLRARPKFAPGATVIVNREPVVPFAMTRRDLAYPEFDDVLAGLRDAAPSVRVVNGGAAVREVGLDRSLNTVMLGALAALGRLPFDAAALWAAAEARCPPRHLEANGRAFDLGVAALGTPCEREPTP